jgi:hypothetical protein
MRTNYNTELMNAINVFSLEPDTYTIEEIKNKYHKLASKYHPDHGGDVATMKLVNLAYKELSHYFDHNLKLNVEDSQEIDLDFVKLVKQMTEIQFQWVKFCLYAFGDFSKYRPRLEGLGFKLSSDGYYYWTPVINSKPVFYQVEKEYRKPEKHIFTARI